MRLSCYDVFLHSHELCGFHLSFHGLRHVEIHFVTVEIGIVRRCTAQIQAKGLALHAAHPMTHHGWAMQRRLAIEQYDVTVFQGPFQNPAGLQAYGHA